MNIQTKVQLLYQLQLSILSKKNDSLKLDEGAPEKEYVDPETASSKDSNKSSNKTLSVEQELYLFLRPNRVSVER